MPPILSDSDRQRLVVDNLHLVHSAARAFFLHNSAISQDELISDGYHALFLASRRYDPSRSAAFSTFAYNAIGGAMADSLRNLSLRLKRHAPLDAVPASFILDDQPSIDIESRTLTAQILAAVDRLPYQERSLLKGHFLEERTLADAATHLGISRRRTFDLLAKALQAVRQQIDDNWTIWPARSPRTKRRFSMSFKTRVVRKAQRGSCSISQLSRELDVPATNIRAWLKRASRAEAQLAA